MISPEFATTHAPGAVVPKGRSVYFKLRPYIGDGGTVGDYARAVQDTWHTYDNTVRSGSRIVAQFKKIFGDPNTTNAEVREAARKAMTEIERQQQDEDRRVNDELAATCVAAGLVECSQMLEVSPAAYVSAGEKTYGTVISEGGSSSTTGTLGTAVMIIIGLMCVVYGAFAGFHIMKGSRDAESLITRLVVLLVISLVVGFIGAPNTRGKSLEQITKERYGE